MRTVSPGKPDDPLHERPARAALRHRGRRRLEHDDLAALRIPEVVDEAVREHAVGEARLAARGRACAVERRLHGRRRDPVGVHDPGLDREHDRDRADDRDDPVDDEPDPARKPAGDLVERMVEPSSGSGSPSAGAPDEASALQSSRSSRRTRAAARRRRLRRRRRRHAGWSRTGTSSRRRLDRRPVPVVALAHALLIV